MLNHGIEDRAKDLFFISYEESSSNERVCKGVKIKVLSSVSILRGGGVDEVCELKPATKVLYSIVQSQDMQMIALIS